MEKLEFKHSDNTRQTKKFIKDEWKSSAEWSKKGKPIKLMLQIFYDDKIGPGYFTFKDGKLSQRKAYKGYKFPKKPIFAISESVENKMATRKQKLDEGIVLMAPLLPVGGLIGMPPKRKDNFEFKGLPGQFDKEGNKVLDENGQPTIKELKYATEKAIEGTIDAKAFKNYKESIRKIYMSLKGNFFDDEIKKYLKIYIDGI